MSPIAVAFLIVAFILFVFATIGWPQTGRYNLMAAGLAFCVAAFIWPALR